MAIPILPRSRVSSRCRWDLMVCIYFPHWRINPSGLGTRNCGCAAKAVRSPVPRNGPFRMDLDSNRSLIVAALGQIPAGDRTALQTVYRLTSAKLFGVCLRILGERSEAEDVLQEVYVTVWRKAAEFDASRASPMT